jgi:hypothetical protein
MDTELRPINDRHYREKALRLIPDEQLGRDVITE